MASVTGELHSIFHHCERYRYPFRNLKDLIPKNGIYLIFENGETTGDYDRIVRIGTHTGINQLRSRLEQHFLKENKDRSIFRKNIGRCLLNKQNKSYLPLWNLDRTSSEGKKKNLTLVDLALEMLIEQQITSYMQANFSFCVVEVLSKQDRLTWEKKLIATLAQDRSLLPSSNWLGHASPIERIRSSGLWQVNEHNHEPMSKADLKDFMECLNLKRFKLNNG
jgi:hypothetical protein